MENTDSINKNEIIVSEMWELLFEFDDVLETLKTKSFFISDFVTKMRRKCEQVTEFDDCKKELTREIGKWSKAEDIDQITKLHDTITQLMSKLKE